MPDDRPHAQLPATARRGKSIVADGAAAGLQGWRGGIVVLPEGHGRRQRVMANKEYMRRRARGFLPQPLWR